MNAHMNNALYIYVYHNTYGSKIAKVETLSIVLSLIINVFQIKYQTPNLQNMYTVWIYNVGQPMGVST